MLNLAGADSTASKLKDSKKRRVKIHFIKKGRVSPAPPCYQAALTPDIKPRAKTRLAVHAQSSAANMLLTQPHQEGTGAEGDNGDGDNSGDDGLLVAGAIGLGVGDEGGEILSERRRGDAAGEERHPGGFRVANYFGGVLTSGDEVFHVDSPLLTFTKPLNETASAVSSYECQQHPARYLISDVFIKG